MSPSQFLSEIDSRFIDEISSSEKEEVVLDTYTEKTRVSMSPTKNMNYNQYEKEYLKKLIQSFKLSPSSLNEYMECPLKFKFNRLLKVPHTKDKILSLGTCIHYALEHTIKQLSSSSNIDIDEVLRFFDTQLNRELVSESDKTELIQEGHQILRKYIKNYASTLSPAVETEYGFFGREVVLVNPKTNEPIMLTGKLDKIEWINKEKFEVKVTDYKTSTPKTRNDILGLTKSSQGNIFRQLVFYKLLTEIDDRFRPAPNQPKYKAVAFEVDFIKPDKGDVFKRESFEVSDQDIENLKEEIFDVMNHINALDFAGSDEYPLCGNCEYCRMFDT